MTESEMVDKAIALAKQLWPNEDGVVIERCMGASKMDSNHIYNREWYIVKTWSAGFEVPQPHMSAARSMEQLIQDLKDELERRG
jgi:hypothetical protein